MPIRRARHGVVQILLRMESKGGARANRRRQKETREVAEGEYRSMTKKEMIVTGIFVGVMTILAYIASWLTYFLVK